MVIGEALRTKRTERSAEMRHLSALNLDGQEGYDDVEQRCRQLLHRGGVRETRDVRHDDAEE